MTAQPRRVLVLTLSFGSGHLRAGRAVAEALREIASDAEVRQVDALAQARRLFRLGYVWPYWLMIRHAPALWDRFFTARLKQRHSRTAPDWAFRFGCPHVFEEIEAFDPDVIVAAEVAACEMASLARRLGITRAPIVNVITDHHAEPAWVRPEVSAYAVASAAVRDQLVEWGAPADHIRITGIPTDAVFDAPADSSAIRARFGLTPERPVVLMMGGGMGPTRMDAIADGLCASGEPMQIVAVTGHDSRVRGRLEDIQARHSATPMTLTVLGWTDEVASLMKCADVLVTKPGGLTTAEAAIAAVPIVMFDAIPGPELHNAERVAAAGAGVLTRGARETVSAVLALLRDVPGRRAMSQRGRALATPKAAEEIASVIVKTPVTPAPVLMVTIRNGAGHTRVAEAIAEGLRSMAPEVPVTIVDVADYMSWTLRLTHVRIYLWLVRYAPWLWERIDRYQKQQPHTSPEWYYRRGCRRLFELAERLQPQAIVATEVGCCEIAALIKRDLDLACPLVAVNGEYDSDRAWIQPEVDAYSVPSPAVHAELVALGAPQWRVHDWGVPLAAEFYNGERRFDARRAVCERLALSDGRPVVLVSGGSEGLGRPDLVAGRLVDLPSKPQVILLAGRNERLRRRAEALAKAVPAAPVRVLGWTDQMATLMRAADVFVSKLGHTFDEARAVGLPLVALEPPPGSEWAQYRLLEEWSAGHAVSTLEQMASAVERAIASRGRATPPAFATDTVRVDSAAVSIARWLVDAIGHRPLPTLPLRPRVATTVPLIVAEEPEA